MFCKKCGAELPEGSSFCPACGALQGFEVSATETSPDVPPTPPTGPHATSKKKKHIPLIVCLSLLVVVVAVGVTLFFTMGKPFFFQHYIQAANFDKAADTYYALSDTDREKANDWLQSYIEEIRDKYYSGEYDFTTTNAMLNDLADYNAVYTQLEGLALEIAQDSTWVTMQESAAQYIEKSDWLQGYKALQNIYPEYRNYEEVLTMRETCIKGIRSDAIVDCQVLAKTGDYRALQEKMDAALEILPQDKELTLAYQDFMDSFVADTLAHAEELFQAGDVDAAISTLSDAEDIYYSEQFTTTISKYVRDDAEAAAAAFAERGDYLGALKLLQDTQLESGESLTDLTSQYEKLLEEDTLNKAAALAADRRFLEAIDLIHSVQEVYYCSEFESAAEEYSTCLPKKLQDCDIIGSDDWIDYVTLMNNIGRGFDNGIQLNLSHPICGTYDLGGKYVQLSGYIAALPQHEANVQISIYADDVLVYSSPQITSSTTYEPIDIDVSGCKLLRLDIQVQELGNYMSPVLSNVLLDVDVS